MLAKVKAVSEGVSIAGDGRHDSMGHSAKFGAYTMFCCTIPMIIHFVLIQVWIIFAMLMASPRYERGLWSKPGMVSYLT